MPLTAPINTPQAMQQLTLADLAARLDPNGKVAKIAEVLTETNEILQDIPYVEGNLPTGHKMTMRTGLPIAYWKRMNEGVPSSKSSVAQVEETCGICQARSIIDVEELTLNGNSAAYRFSEDKAFIQTMNQTMTRALFYNDSRKNTAGFMGLAPRFDHVVPAANRFDKDLNDCCVNVIDCGGTGDNLTSIWIIGWSPETVFGIYPKGTKVGLEYKDKGEVRVLDAYGNPYDAVESVYTWRNGLGVKDWRFIVRLANIDVVEFMKGKGYGSGKIQDEDSYNLILAIQEGLNKIPTSGGAKVCLYMNSDVHSLLNVISARSNANVIQIMQGMNALGQNRSWSAFLGYPMRRVDALTNYESKLPERVETKDFKRSFAAADTIEIVESRKSGKNDKE